FRSPFEDKIAISSDKGTLIADATRIAQPSTSTVNVERIALNEKILSDPVKSNRVLGETYLKINIGEEEVDVRFGGGRIDDLAEAINRQAGAYLTAKITRDTDKTAVLVLEVNNTGEKNRIAVDDGATSDFFRDIGLFKEESGLEVDTEFKQESIFPIEESSEYRVYDEVLTLEPENSVEFILDKSVMADPNVYLKIKIRAVEVKEEEKPEEPVLWPELKNIGKVTIRDVSVEGGRSISKIEVPEEEKVEPVVIDNNVIGIGNEAGLVGKLDVDALADNFTEYTFRLTDILKEDEQINRIFFINRNTGRRIEYRGLVLEDTSVREGISPKHPVQNGRDAVLYIDGVKIIRDTNEFEDVIKGVKIKLRKESKEEVLLKIDRDYEKITGKIVDMVSRYNELLKYINEQTGATVSEILSEENETGILSGDITVMGLKSKL
ncbi:MAG: flagellar filament capping protein FliD, partial [Spirochaetes bacterium]|nr:flagellar filament capping protein FliD [Spirochaetota bacterium]